MEFLVGFIVIALVVWGVINDIEKERKKKIQELIEAGILVELTNGELRFFISLTSSEKLLLPNYKYLSEHGVNYGFSDIEHLTFEQLKEAVSIVKRKLNEEENIRRRIAAEERKQEDEKRKLDAERESKERIRLERLSLWEKLSLKVLFEIDKANIQCKKKGIYVIHSIADNKLYIGSTINMLIRKSQHLSGLRNRKHHSYLLQNAFNEFGESNFKFYAIELIDEDDFLLKNHYEDEIKKQRALKKHIKSLEQSYLDEYSPTFNIETDARGQRHWAENSKYWYSN